MYRNYVIGVSGVAISCSGFIPSGPGYGTECADLIAGGTCTQTCTSGYSDLNNPDGLVHTCVDGHLGTTTNTLLNCVGQ